MAEAVATSRAVALMGTASTDEASTGEASTGEASLDSGSWTATDPGTATDIPTGTESLRVTMNALSSASV